MKKRKSTFALNVTSSSFQPFYSFHRERFPPRAFIYSGTLLNTRREILNNERKSKRERKLRNFRGRSYFRYYELLSSISGYSTVSICDFYFHKRIISRKKKQHDFILELKCTFYVGIKCYFQPLE